MSLIIPPVECAEEGCASKEYAKCKNCKYRFEPWFVVQDKPKRKRRRKRLSPQAVIKYLLIAIVGILLYLVAANYALSERGYIAYGGELVFLLLPLWWAIAELIIKDNRRQKGG